MSASSPEYSRAPFRLLLRPIGTVDQDEKLMKTTEKFECTTPTAEEFKLPVVPLTCPRAPRKAARGIRCKRRLTTELEFVVVGQEEMESLFKRRDSADDDQQQLQISAKKRKMIITE